MLSTNTRAISAFRRVQAPSRKGEVQVLPDGQARLEELGPMVVRSHDAGPMPISQSKMPGPFRC